METIGIIKEPNGTIYVEHYENGKIIISQPALQKDYRDCIVVVDKNIKKLITILKKIKT